jgi:hypothetical protein
MRSRAARRPGYWSAPTARTRPPRSCRSEAGPCCVRRAAVLREAAGLYELDPTLERDPVRRDRALDLIDELGRRVIFAVRQASNGQENPRWPLARRWEEAEAIAGRLPALLGKAREAARADHAAPAGSRDISRLRLAAARHQVRQAGEQLHTALARALELPCAAPEALELATLADQILARTAGLHPPARASATSSSGDDPAAAPLW